MEVIEVIILMDSHFKLKEILLFSVVVDFLLCNISFFSLFLYIIYFCIAMKSLENLLKVLRTAALLLVAPMSSYSQPRVLSTCTVHLRVILTGVQTFKVTAIDHMVQTRVSATLDSRYPEPRRPSR
jgi:hypothetical protein